MWSPLFFRSATKVGEVLGQLCGRSSCDPAGGTAEADLNEIIDRSHVVIDVQAVKSLAMRLLRLHSLRAFDALQLGAALHWTEGHPQGRGPLTFDERLAQAAAREGFVVPAVRA